METFADRMMELLPEIYLESDTNGDLKVFLSVVGQTLDELKRRIDEIPDLVSAEDSPPDFLAVLAALVGAEYDPKLNPTPQRQWLMESIDRYRRTGTTAGMKRELTCLGWSGQLVETFRSILRLNYHSKLNRQKLPGKQYNHGIYGVTEPLDTPEFLETAKRHQPAGTILWMKEEGKVL